jgi:hypothetical protein
MDDVIDLQNMTLSAKAYRSRPRPSDDDQICSKLLCRITGGGDNVA